MGDQGRALRDVAFRLQVLGDVGLWQLDGPASSSDQAIAVPALGQGKALALLIYLSAAPRRRSSREHLLAMLWSDRAPDEARHILRQILWSVRRRFGVESLAADGDELVLGRTIACDRDEFLAAIEDGRLSDALALYRSDFLPQFASPGTSDFERWAELERQRLRAVFLRASEARTRQILSSGQPRQALAVVRRAREVDAHDEGMWRLLIEAQIAAGDMVGAATEADLLERYASQEGIVLEGATRAIVRQARKAEVATEDDHGAGRRVVPELVGREKEFAIMLSAWDRVRTSGPSMRIEVASEAGFGKSRFLRDVELRLRSMRARVVALRAHPGQRGVSFAFAADMAAALAALPGAAGISAGAAASLVALNPSLSGSYPTAMPEGASGDEAVRRRTFALQELLASVADDAPIAMLVDDAHWIDPCSRAVVSGALQRLTTERVLSVLATRPIDVRLVDAPDASLRMRALGAEETEALVASLGELPEEEWARVLVTSIHRVTAGIPLMIIDLLERLLDRGLLERHGRTWVAPARSKLADALQAPGAGARGRLDALSAAEASILTLLAVAGEPTRLAPLAAADGSDEHVLGALLDALERHGLVRRGASGYELTHDTLVEAMLETAGPEPARQAHLSLGRALAAQRDAPYFVLMRAAQHLASSGADDELTILLERVVRMARAAGNRRGVNDFARDAMGGVVDELRLRRVARETQWRLNRGKRRAIGIAAIALAGVGLWGALRPATAAQKAAEASFIVLYDGTGDAVGARIELTREMFQPVSKERTEGAGTPIDARTAGTRMQYILSSAYFQDAHIAEQPNGKAWAFSMSGELQSRVGISTPTKEEHLNLRTIVRHAGAVGTVSWAPDGSMIAFTRERYDVDGLSEIAIVDVSSKQLRTLRIPQLANGSARSVSWSPDGSRLAFVQASSDSATGEVCWTTLDGESFKCGMAKGRARFVHAWYDADRVVVEVEAQGRRDLVRITLDGGEEVIIERDVPDILVSPDGRWVARRCARPVCPMDWNVGPIGRPEVARPVLVSALTGAALRKWREDSALSIKQGVVWGPPTAHPLQLRWGAVTPPRPYIAALNTTVDPIRPRIRFATRVVDQHGSEMRSSMLRHYSLDTADAVISDSGWLMWKRPDGVARLVITVGGWRADTSLMLAPPADGAMPSLQERRRRMREAYRRWRSPER